MDHFNNEGVCGACLWIEEQETINWDLRFKELEGRLEHLQSLVSTTSNRSGGLSTTVIFFNGS